MTEELFNVTDETIEFLNAKERILVFRTQVTSIREKEKGVEILVTQYDEPFFVPVSFDIVKIRLGHVE